MRNRNPSFTKPGPGRRAYTAKERKSAAGKSLTQQWAGAYGRGLRNAITAKAAAKLAQSPSLRDENGAVTLTGRPRRIWLAGISAQRGY